MASEATPTLPGAAVQLAKRVSCPLTERTTERREAMRDVAAVVDQSGSETRTSCAGRSQIDEWDGSHGIRTTPEASHLIRMRSMVAAGGAAS